MMEKFLTSTTQFGLNFFNKRLFLLYLGEKEDDTRVGSRDPFQNVNNIIERRGRTRPSRIEISSALRFSGSLFYIGSISLASLIEHQHSSQEFQLKKMLNSFFFSLYVNIFVL